MLKNTFTIDGEITVDKLNKIINRPNFKGTISGVPNEVYHQCDGLSASGLVKMGQSIAHYFHSKENKEKTPQLEFGSLVHEVILEPNLSLKKYALPFSSEKYPNALKTTADIKSRLQELKLKVTGTKPELIARLLEADPGAQVLDLLKEKYEMENKDRTIISEQNFKGLEEIISKIRAQPYFMAFFKKGISEQTFFWTDQETGLLCKCKVDFLSIVNNTYVPFDVKTTVDASEDGFPRQVVTLFYDMKAVFYMDGISEVLEEPIDSFVFGAIEKKTWEPALHCLDNREHISYGRLLYRARLEKYCQYLREYKQSNGKTWAGYPQEVIPLELPAWAFNRR